MQKAVRDFIKEYNHEFKSTVILTSHYMDDVKELCKRAIIIDHGHKIFDGRLQDIIDKYARNKILSLTFDDEVSLEKLKTFGEVKSFEPPQATLLVPRKDAAKVAAEVISKLPIDDINIEEPPIEAIIREVFQNKNV